jgi:hypothetical protein
MSDIIPSEVITVPLLIILLAFFVPVLCLKFIFIILNKILKTVVVVSKSNKYTCITAWLFPLVFILPSHFAESTITYILYCLVSCLVGAVIAYISAAKTN